MTQSKAIQKKKKSSKKNKNDEELDKEERKLFDVDTSVVNKYGDLFVTLTRELGIKRERISEGEKVLEFDTEERKSIFKIPDISKLYGDIRNSETLEFPSEIISEVKLNLEIADFEKFDNPILELSTPKSRERVEISKLISESENNNIRIKSLSITPKTYPEAEISSSKREYMKELTNKEYREGESPSKGNYILSEEESEELEVGLEIEEFDNKLLSEGIYSHGNGLNVPESIISLDKGQEISYFGDKNETKNSRRIVFEMDEDLYEKLGKGATVKDALMYLNDEGLEITIAEQPFYSPDKFDKVTDPEDKGWKDSYFMVQSINGYSTENMEILTGEDGELELAQDSIENIEISENEYIALDFSEDYGSCGKVNEEIRERIKEEYVNNYGVWIEDDWERGIYTSLTKNSKFYGSPFDISRASEAREAYIDTFGNQPEKEFDNIVFKGARNDQSTLENLISSN